MRENPYAFGFVAACVALLTLTAAFIYSTASGDTPKATENAFSFINSVSSMIQAFAAIGVASLAFKGYNAWKDQIIHGKALGIAWDAQVAVRQLEMAQIKFSLKTQRATVKVPGDPVTIVGDSPLGAAFEEFEKQCNLLDKVVVKNDWEWTNYCTELRMLALAHYAEASKPVYPYKAGAMSGNPQFRDSDKLDAAQANWAARVELIASRLSGIEKKYS